MKNQALKIINQVDELIKDKKIFDIFPNSSLEIKFDCQILPCSPNQFI